jgi:hypothetical protein
MAKYCFQKYSIFKENIHHENYIYVPVEIKLSTLPFAT